MSRVRSAAGSARYFADDNFFRPEDATPLTRWVGAGATLSGLIGQPTAAELEALLSGRMTDGSIIRPGGNAAHGLGSDFVFSVPKSVSLLALIGGDSRLLAANRQAVLVTLKIAEERYASARKRRGGGVSLVLTGNLLAAIFEHDTSRELDPHVHIHVLIVNATRTCEGRWRALHNRPLWRANAALGEMHATHLRSAIEDLGYRTQRFGKHGMFEMADVPRDVIEAFSLRRTQLLSRASKLDHWTPRSIDSAQQTSRRRKATAVDRAELLTAWFERAREVGFDFRSVIADAALRGSEGRARRDLRG